MIDEGQEGEVYRAINFNFVDRFMEPGAPGNERDLSRGFITHTACLLRSTLNRTNNTKLSFLLSFLFRYSNFNLIFNIFIIHLTRNFYHAKRRKKKNGKENISAKN